MNFSDNNLEKNQNDLMCDTYRYKLMIVDDSSIARKLIKKFAVPINANIVCEASSADEAYSKYVEFEPDVVTMDISMPGGSGIEAVKKIRSFDPDAKILMVTSHGEESMVIDALEAGAKGFLLKPVTKEKLLKQFDEVKYDPFKMFKSVHYFKDLEGKNLKKLSKFSVRSDYLILMAENSKGLTRELSDMSFDYVGGVFPEIIYESKVYQEGFVILELSKEANLKLIKQMDEPISESMKSILNNKQTLLTIADGLSPHLDSFLQNLSSMLNENINVLGSAAGVKGMEQTSSIFTPYGTYSDAAILIYSYEPLKLGQAHGWNKFAGPFEITQSKLNMIEQFDDDESPLAVYEDFLKTECDISIEDDTFLDLLKQYPLGIKKRKNTLLREIMRTSEESLCSLGNFELNSLAYIMKGDEDDLKEAAKNAVICAKGESDSSQMRFSLLFEGIGRRHYNNDDEIINHDFATIKEELKNIPQCGAVSLMEFSNYNSKAIEIHSNSILVGVVH